MPLYAPDFPYGIVSAVGGKELSRPRHGCHLPPSDSSFSSRLYTESAISYSSGDISREPLSLQLRWAPRLSPHSPSCLPASFPELFHKYSPNFLVKTTIRIFGTALLTSVAFSLVLCRPYFLTPLILSVLSVPPEHKRKRKSI